MTHRIKSLVLGCLLFGQFHCHLFAMSRVLSYPKPVEKLLQLRQQAWLRGSQVPLSSWLRKDIARIASSRQQFLLLDQIYAHILRGAGIIFILFIAHYSLRALSIYIRQLQFERKIKKAQSHRKLIETKILPHFPEAMSVENCGNTIAEFLDYGQSLNNALKRRQDQYVSKQKLLFQNSFLDFAKYINNPLGLITSNLVLFTSAIIFLSWCVCIFNLYVAPSISFFYGPQEAANTLSLLIYHNYDKFILVTAPLLMLKYTAVLAMAGYLHDRSNQIRVRNQ